VTCAGVAAAITDERVIAVVRLRAADQVIDVVDALVAGGIRVVEITMTVPDAICHIERLAASVPASVILGVGTVTESRTAAAAIAAGARFVASPVCRPALIDDCHRRGAAVMPGCLTPTEILAASEAGADFVKLFPASAVGPSFIRDITGPFPGIRLVPTGGVGLDTAAGWLDAGAAAVGVGGGLLDPRAIAAGDFAAITAAATRLVAAVAAVPVRGSAVQ
jgi:2-dehydro-3-deoxyphosphogluconate aldolase/(4S)-4-hydroxy-2-oxoglutarate aldolase